MKRPHCYEFGMEFMGDPEKTEISQYVEWLEKRVEELEAARQSVQRTCESCGAIEMFSDDICPECDGTGDNPAGHGS